jgi:hypothetical protein
VSAGAVPSVLARFMPYDATTPRQLLGEDAFRVREIDGKRVSQGRLVLAPGRYELTLMVVDPGTAETGIRRETIVIPVREDALHVSDLLWAKEIESLPYASLVTYTEPYMIGAFRVVPRIEERLVAGETLRLFYEIYGGSSPYRVTYQLEGQEDDGTWVALGTPSTHETSVSAQGWELPTSPRWPAGNYRLRLSIRDAAEALVLEAPGPAR